MPDKILELQATMNDRVSDALRQIKRNVDDLNKSTVNLTTQKKDLQALGQELQNLGRAGQGIQQTTKHLRDFHQQFKDVGDRFRETGRAVKEQLAPAFEGLGFGVTTVGGAFATLAATMKSVIDESRNIQNIAKLSGFTPDQIAAMQTGVHAFGLSADKVMSIVGNIAKQMDLIAGTPGGGGSSLLGAARHTLGLEGLANDLTAIARNPDITVAQRNMQGVARTLQELQRVQRDFGSQRAGSIADQLHLDRETILLIQQGIDPLKHWLDLQRRIGEDIDPAKLAQIGVAQDQLAASIGGLKLVITADLIDDATKLTTAIANYIDVNKEEVGHGVADGVREIGSAIQETVPLLGQLKTVIDYAEKIRKWEEDFGKGQRERLSSTFGPAPILPGVDTVRGAMGLSPIGGGLTGADVLKMQNYGAPTAPSAAPGFLATAGQQFSDLFHGRFGATKWGGATAQPFGESGVPAGVIDQATMFKPGSLGAGSITTGWRPSTNVEDQRSNEEVVADDASRKGTDDNTSAQRDNTDQLRKLIDILSRGHGNAVMDMTGGMGAGGMGGGFGAGQGPMYRPGVGPGTRARPGVNNAPTGPSGPAYTPPAGTRPRVASRATRTAPPGTPSAPAPPSAATVAQPPPVTTDSSLMPSVVPRMQDGGMIRSPATVVDQATGQPVATMAENKPELVVPLPEDPSLFGITSNKSIPAPIRYRNPGAQRFGPEVPMFGGGPEERISSGYISPFPTAQQGAAANMGLLARRYTNTTVYEGQGRWSDQHRHDLKPYSDIDPQTVITPDMARDRNFVIPFMKSVSQYEAGRPYPLSDDQWNRAFDLYMQGGPGAGGAPSQPPQAPGTMRVGPPTGKWQKFPMMAGGGTEEVINKMMRLDGLRAYNAGDLAKIRQYMKDGGQSLDPATSSWCAATVDSALKQAGYPDLQGANKYMATQFRNYPGASVVSEPGNLHVDQIQRGDVLMFMRGHQAPEGGGHVGMMLGGYDEKSQSAPFFSGNWGNAAVRANIPLARGGDNLSRATIMRLPIGNSTAFDKFPKGQWQPTAPGAAANLPDALRSQMPAAPHPGNEPSSLSWVLPEGVGNYFDKPAPAPPKPTGAPSTATEKTPATGAGQQPKSIRLGHGKPAYGWAPGQGGQTNVPGYNLFGASAAGDRTDFEQRVREVQAATSGMLQIPSGGAVGAARGIAASGAKALWSYYGSDIKTKLAEMYGREDEPRGDIAFGGPTPSNVLGRQLGVGDISAHQPAGGLGGGVGTIQHKVEGTGTINVNIKAPKGTNVNAESSGLFKKVNLNRGMSMEHADEHGQYAQ